LGTQSTINVAHEETEFIKSERLFMAFTLEVGIGVIHAVSAGEDVLSLGHSLTGRILFQCHNEGHLGRKELLEEKVN
jgi:hypothetical protein